MLTTLWADVSCVWIDLVRTWSCDMRPSRCSDSGRRRLRLRNCSLLTRMEGRMSCVKGGEAAEAAPRSDLSPGTDVWGDHARGCFHRPGHGSTGRHNRTRLPTVLGRENLRDATSANQMEGRDKVQSTRSDDRATCGLVRRTLSRVVTGVNAVVRESEWR